MRAYLARFPHTVALAVGLLIVLSPLALVGGIGVLVSVVAGIPLGEGVRFTAIVLPITVVGIGLAHWLGASVLRGGGEWYAGNRETDL